MTPQETEPNQLLVLEGVLWRGLTIETGHWKVPLWHKPSCSPLINLTIEPINLQVWVALGQTTTRERVQSHPSADNWIKALLSKALPTRARPSFSHCQSLPSGSLHKPLGLIHQRADRRSKKHTVTAANTKTILQKVNHDGKAESYLPDEDTR